MLTQAGVDSIILKQVVGHSEKGVTFSNYFKGFTVQQLYDGVICKIETQIPLICTLSGTIMEAKGRESTCNNVLGTPRLVPPSES